MYIHEVSVLSSTVERHKESQSDQNLMRQPGN